MQQDEFDSAIESLSTATRLQPSMVQGWISLGQARRAALDDAGALVAFRRAVALDPNNGEVQDLLGSAYLANHAAHEAIVHFRESLRLRPDDRATLSHLQRALRLDGQIDQAHEEEARMKELLTDRERINQTALESARLNNEGVALERQGELRPALEKYRTAVDLDPEHDGFRLNYGLALCRLNRWNQGIAEIREVVRRSPDNAEATRDLYIALDKRNHLNSSQQSDH